jgi:hypothetical protein
MKFKKIQKNKCTVHLVYYSGTCFKLLFEHYSLTWALNIHVVSKLVMRIKNFHNIIYPPCAFFHWIDSMHDFLFLKKIILVLFVDESWIRLNNIKVC